MRPRLAAIPPEEMSTEQTRVRDAIASSARKGVRGPFPALLRRPELAERVAQLGDVIRYGTGLSPRMLELVVLVTARSLRCELEWHAHGAMATAAGLEADVIEAIRVGAQPAFTDENERLAHDYVKQLQEDHRVSDTTYQAALEAFGEQMLVDLTAVVGYFAMVATTINAHQLENQPDLPPPFDDVPTTA